MADAKISDLSDGGGLTGDDLVAIARSGTSYHAKGIGVDGWISDSAETWTYASFSAGPPAVGTFTISGDLTAKYTIGTRIKLTQTTVKYFVVTAASYNAGTTTTTVSITGGTDYTLANAAISANYHSYDANPQGYPTWFSGAAAGAGFSAKTSDTLKFAMFGRTCFVLPVVVGTSNATTLTFTLPVTASDTVSASVLVTNNGTTALGRLAVSAASSTATCGLAAISGAIVTMPAGGFTSSGSKAVNGALFAYLI